MTGEEPQEPLVRSTRPTTWDIGNLGGVVLIWMLCGGPTPAGDVVPAIARLIAP